jgi:hypothetical protein
VSNLNSICFAISGGAIAPVSRRRCLVVAQGSGFVTLLIDLDARALEHFVSLLRARLAQKPAQCLERCFPLFQ